MKNTLLSFCLSIILIGCVSIDATKAVGLSGKEICIIDNPNVRQDLRGAYERRIQAKGYKTQIIKEASACPITSTYTATYGNHWGLYLATSELKIFNGGALIGQVRYKAPYASPEKHGRVENKIESMVDQLLP
ncbi:MAG: hypothetical protein HY308_02490 [Gammaproteobacteria bacterium]|nr:hypothetical protein [Gammaproteobacteria bacterium]